jgi:LacI family transcriptional regulator
VPPPKDGRPTLATVAASAGVSVATVSKVLNGRTDVSPTTRALVEDVLKRQAYVGRRTDPARRAPVRTTIELAFPVKLNAYSTELIEGILDAATDADVSVVLSRCSLDLKRPDDEHISAWVRHLIPAGRQAVIAVTSDLTAADVAALERARLPLVVVDPLHLPHTRVTSIGSTNFAGGLAATQHLLSLGHRRIAYVGGWPDAACNLARLHGYRAAMEAVGAPVPEEYICTGEFHYEDGTVGGAALLALDEPPTAVFAGCDEAAAGVIESARSRGLRVPEDLSIVGFDDTQVAQYSSPPLTTVRQPLREMGGVALRTAMRLASGEKLDSHHVELATELVVRRSTAPPPPEPATGRA